MYLEQHFGDVIISLYFPFPWTLRSPDLTSMDFRFWEYIKSRIYMCNLQTLSNLKDYMKRDIANIAHVMLRSTLLSTVFLIQ